MRSCPRCADVSVIWCLCLCFLGLYNKCTHRSLLVGFGLTCGTGVCRTIREPICQHMSVCQCGGQGGEEVGWGGGICICNPVLVRGWGH